MVVEVTDYVSDAGAELAPESGKGKSGLILTSFSGLLSTWIASFLFPRPLHYVVRFLLQAAPPSELVREISLCRPITR